MLGVLFSQLLPVLPRVESSHVNKYDNINILCPTCYYWPLRAFVATHHIRDLHKFKIHDVAVNVTQFRNFLLWFMKFRKTVTSLFFKFHKSQEKKTRYINWVNFMYLLRHSEIFMLPKKISWNRFGIFCRHCVSWLYLCTDSTCKECEMDATYNVNRTRPPRPDPSLLSSLTKNRMLQWLTGTVETGVQGGP